MSKIKHVLHQNPLFYAFFFPAFTDGALTLLGQGADYWKSGAVNEASPAYYFLLASPWLFVLGSLVWFLFWYWLFKHLKEPINLFLMFLFIAGHSWGSTSWIWKIAKDNGWYVGTNQISVMKIWGVVVLYFALIGSLASYNLRVYLDQRKKSQI